MNESADALEEASDVTPGAIVVHDPKGDVEVIPPDDGHVLPADLGSLSDEQKAEVGHNIQSQIIGDTQNVMARYLRIGKNLYAVAKFELFKQLGYNTFDEWRAQPEMQVARTTAYALMKVYEVFIERLKVEHEKLTGLDWTKLYAVCRFVTQENVEEVLSKVETLSRGDLQREVSILRAQRSGKTQSQAESHVADLDLVRECCPIGCGSTCPLIAQDEDAAVVAFKKWLGNWRTIHAKIKGLFGKRTVKSPEHEPSQSDGDGDAPAQEPPAEEVPPAPGDSPAAERGEPHVPEPASVQQDDGKAVHGQDANAGGQAVEGGSVPARQGGKGPVWPT